MKKLLELNEISDLENFKQSNVNTIKTIFNDFQSKNYNVLRKPHKGQYILVGNKNNV